MVALRQKVEIKEKGQNAKKLRPVREDEEQEIETDEPLSKRILNKCHGLNMHLYQLCYRLRLLIAICL